MIDPFWFGLGAKMASSAAIVVLASLVVERAGPFWGAMIATLPISAGPAYVFIAMDHDAAFVEQSSLLTLAINAATAIFVLVYAALAQRRSLAVSLGAAFAVWLGVAALVRQQDWTLPAAIAVNIVGFAVCLRLSAPFRVARKPAGLPIKRWWDIPLRAVGVMTLVAVVVMAGRLLGPAAAGLAAAVPVVLSSLAIVLHPRLGGPATAAMFASGAPGLIGFGVAVAVLHATVMSLGSAMGLALGLAICIAWNLGLAAARR